MRNETYGLCSATTTTATCEMMFLLCKRGIIIINPMIIKDGLSQQEVENYHRYLARSCLARGVHHCHHLPHLRHCLQHCLLLLVPSLILFKLNFLFLFYPSLSSSLGSSPSPPLPVKLEEMTSLPAGLAIPFDLSLEEEDLLD